VKLRSCAFGLIALAIGCGSRSRDRAHEEQSTASPSAAREPEPAALPPSPPGPKRALVIDAADPSAACVFGYRGPVLELGEQRQAAQFGVRLDAPPVDWTEREGSSWARVRGKSISVSFFAVPPADLSAEGPAGATPFLQARIRGGVAKSVAFTLNGHAIGGGAIARGETRVLAVKSSAAQPLAGQNELTMRFTGVPKGTVDPSLEIEWVHFGIGEPDPEYAAPMRGDTRVSKSFAGQPERALSLRGPGFARCAGWIPNGSVVETRARLEGTGAADAEVRFVRDRAPPTVIGTLHLDAADASDAANARTRSWPVGELGALGTVGAVELSVVRASRGARVIFGEPRVLGPVAVAAPTPRPAVAARGVVLIVMSQLGVHSLSPYGGALVTPAIAALASSGDVFAPSRATTGVANGAVGSMLTGLTARDLGLTDGDSRLPHTVTTIADAVRQAGIVSAFFTANPLTSAAFGFDRGWAHFEAHGPTEDGPATRVFDSAVTWLGEHANAPFFIMIHARGGHPPWDVSLERVKTLPPENYTGGLEARRAGELFGRSFRTPGAYRFDDADRARAWALYGAAMEAEDAGVGRVVAALKLAGVLESTTVIVTSDVGVNDTVRVPFAESEALDETSLATPLIIQWAHEAGHGARIEAVTSEEDLGTTVLAAFALPAPAAFRGRDLRLLAAESALPEARPELAVDRDRFALRWGAFVSAGVRDREGKLCDLSLEPACVTDVRESYPLASSLLHGALFDALVSARPPLPREPAALDAVTQAALKLWGR
jgi:arylsulfatase A-like enzyme